MYLLCKEELMTMNNSENTKVEERILYHATSPNNAEKIARHNIDWRRTIRSRYGKGACFSPSPVYANKYALNRGGRYFYLLIITIINIYICVVLAFLICKVLTKKIENVDVNYDLQIPSSGYDTTLSNSEMVFVKYDDYTYYPEFIVYYGCK